MQRSFFSAKLLNKSFSLLKFWLMLNIRQPCLAIIIISVETSLFNFRIILAQRDKLICKDQGSQNLNCSDFDAVIDIVHAELKPTSRKTEICPKSKVSKKNSCEFESDVSFEVKSMCQGRTWCNLSVNSVEAGQCLEQDKHLLISYQCVKRSNDTYAG